MIGLTWKDIFQADDKIGLAFTQPLAATEVLGDGATGEVDPQMWEAYYSFKANHYTEYRGTVFGRTDRNGTANDDISGVVFQTTFKF